MSWSREWQALKIRSEGLAIAADTFLSALKNRDTDDLSLVRKLIVPTGRGIWADLTSFKKRHQSILPAGAKEALERIATLEFADADSHRQANLQLAIGLRTIVSEVDFYIRDHETLGRSIVEWAFLHLRRSLVVDVALRARWMKAFAKGEVDIEKTGAIHLLSHGIYAFKASGAGAATDLILGTAVLPGDPDLVNARVLALTEWKLARSAAEATAQAEAARRQARQYASGLLAGTELNHTRYVVLVSADEVGPTPGDVTDGTVTYRHVGIVIKAPTPSRSRTP
jgi:hypothetical protein